jgi:hypothetical protein
VADVQADTDRGVVDRGHLSGQLRGPDGVSVLDGQGHVEASGEVSRLPQRVPLRSELDFERVSGVADHHRGPDLASEPDARRQHLNAIVVASFRVSRRHPGRI